MRERPIKGKYVLLEKNDSKSFNKVTILTKQRKNAVDLIIYTGMSKWAIINEKQREWKFKIKT